MERLLSDLRPRLVTLALAHVHHELTRAEYKRLSRLEWDLLSAEGR